MRLHAFGSSAPVNLRGKIEIEIGAKKSLTTATFYIAEQSTGSLLNYATSVELDILQLSLNTVQQTAAPQTSKNAKQKNSAREQNMAHNNIEKKLRHKFPNVFEGNGKRKNYKQSLHVDSQILSVSQTYRRTPFHLRKKLDNLLNDYIDNFIEPAKDESTDWVSGLVVTPKLHNPSEVRVCGDYRQVNLAVKRKQHTVPAMDELLEDLKDTKKISNIDLRAGRYHRIPSTKKARSITMFVPHRGLFRYKRLPFGINSASEVFQNGIQNAFCGLEGTRNIADDIIVWDRNDKEHNQRLHDSIFPLTRKRFNS